jgi:uncharacterized protein YecE (DUF72 family)
MWRPEPIRTPTTPTEPVIARARIGISGWVYPPWRGVFYPKGLRQADELAYAADRLTSIEINGSFYALQKPESWRRWRDGVPDDFVFAVKGPRYITHLLRLREPRAALANFFASGVLALGPKLGPVLWQLPPHFAFDPDVFDVFLGMLPRTTGEAVALATERDVERMRGREVLETESDAPLRHAVEVRDARFDDPRMRDALRRRGIAAVLADTAGRYPVIDDDTADFRYVRLHGDTELYASGYDDGALDRWAQRVRGWTAAGEDVYAYFDNDQKVRSPVDAMGLIARVGDG